MIPRKVPAIAPHAVLACLSAHALHAAPAETGDSNRPTNASPALSITSIFDSAEFNAESFDGRWLPDEPAYTTREPARDNGPGKDIVRNDPASGTQVVLVPSRDLIPPGQSSPLAVEDHAWSRDRSRLLVFTQSQRVWRTHSRGDYWVLDRSSRELSRLGGDAPASSLMFAKFSPDGGRVAYVRERNLYVEDLRTHAITALTTNRSPNVINGTFDWVYEEEFGLRDGFRWSPDGSRIAFWQLDTSGVREVPLVNNTDGLYPKVQWIPYPKTGDLNPACRVGVVEVATGEIRWLPVPGDPRAHYVFDLQWPDASPFVFLQQLNRRQDTNRMFLADPVTLATREFLVDRDDAWVDSDHRPVWFQDGKRFLFWSQRDGWRHLHLAHAGEAKARTVTQGDFDVTELVHLDEAKGHVYFIASPSNPTQRHLFRIDLDGRHLQRITPKDAQGSHAYVVSHDGRWAFHTHSSFLQPPVTDLVSLPDHKSVRVLKDNQALKDKLAALELPKADFLRVRAGTNVEIDGWRIRPPKTEPGRKYPVLVHVYGEPAGSTVRDAWGGKNLLWHLMLAQQGYNVLSFDNRGTAAPRGRAWAKSIHRKVGVLASQDQADALQHVLAKHPDLDPGRVAIWGWSGGGSMTLNALFRHPQLYHAGIAVAAVPDMRQYDTIYQERYMGLPDDNAEAYRAGSPVHFAHQLQGRLLVIHGTGDDNCHYQGFEDLIDTLIRHKKPFQMMAYPNRSHSISEGEGTAVHLRETMTRFLHEAVPPGPR